MLGLDSSFGFGLETSVLGSSVLAGSAFLAVTFFFTGFVVFFAFLAAILWRISALNSCSHLRVKAATAFSMALFFFSIKPSSTSASFSFSRASFSLAFRLTILAFIFLISAAARFFAASVTLDFFLATAAVAFFNAFSACTSFLFIAPVFFSEAPNTFLASCAFFMYFASSDDEPVETFFFAGGFLAPVF